MNSNRNDSQIKQILITKGIEQAWRRRFSYSIHSGARVKIQRRNSSFDQTNRMQSIIKRIWIDSETSALCENGQKLSEIPSENQSLITYPMKTSSIDKNTNSIGIQTIMIRQIDRQTSCDIVIPTSMLSQKSSSSTSVSFSQTSDSTQTNSTSTDISIVSSTTLGTSENDDYKKRYRRNRNRNNNAIDTDVERKNNLIKMEETVTQLSINKQPLQDLNIKTQCYSQSTSLPVLSSRKKGFFNSFLNLFSFLRLSSFKRDQVNRTQVIPDVNQNETYKNIRSPTSRCRRSRARNFNHNLPIDSEKHYFQTRSEENSSAKLNHLKQNASIQSFPDISISTRKQCRQTNNSSLSNIDSRKNTLSHRLNKNLNKTIRRKHSQRKKHNNNRYHTRKYLHRKRRKHIPTSKKSSQSIQPLSPNNDHSKLLVEENVKPSVFKTGYPNNNCLSLHEEVKQTSLITPMIENNSPQKEILPSQQQNLSLKTIDHLSTDVVPCTTSHPIYPSNILSSLSFENKQYFSPPTDSIRLRVKNKNLLSTLSTSKTSFSSIYPMNTSLKHHQMNTVNEFKSILQQIKNINNNALDNNPPVEISPLKTDTKEILTSTQKPTVLPMKNQNENKPQPKSSVNQSLPTENSSMQLEDQNEIIREGIQELIHYQKLAKSYKLTNNKTVKDFLMKSTALSPESLQKLSILNEPNSTSKRNKNTK